MKPFLMAFLAGAGLIGALASAPAAGNAGEPEKSVPFLFEAAIVIDKSTPACDALGYVETGTQYEMRLRPPKLGNNGAKARASVTLGDVICTIVSSKGDFSAKFKDVYISNIKDIAQNDYTARMKVTEMSPATLNKKTKFASFSGAIRNFGDIPDCRVTFHAAMTKR